MELVPSVIPEALAPLYPLLHPLLRPLCDAAISRPTVPVACTGDEAGAVRSGTRAHARPRRGMRRKEGRESRHSCVPFRRRSALNFVRCSRD